MVTPPTTSPTDGPNHRPNAVSLYLESFASQHFRNLTGLPIELHPRFNLFYGNNGQGKTNFLEAIYYLFTLRPMRPVRPRQLIAWGQQQASVKGNVCGRTERTLRATFSQRERKVELNGAPPLRLDDYFEGTQVVAFSPEDIQLVRGAPEGRRKWIDRAVFNTELGYLNEVRHYLRLLGHRNAILKESTIDDALFEVITEQFVEAGARLVRRRLTLINHLRPHLQSAFKRIFPEQDIAIKLTYQSNLNPPSDIDPDTDPFVFEDATAERFRAQLQRQSRREKERRSSLVGPHLDDIQFVFQGHPFKTSASQGQTRGLVLALKVAEILELERRTGHHPILILDDVAGELDPTHSSFLFAFLEETRGQVLLSTTDLSNIPLADINQYPHIHLEDGNTSLTSL